MKSILAIGHSTFDTFLKVDQDDFKMSPKFNEISFAAGAKIDVKEIHYGVGGSSANVAVGVSKLGLQTYIYTIIGNDMKGMDIISVFKKNNVNSIYLRTDQNPTNQSAIISYDTDRTIFSYHHERQYSIKNFDLFQDYIFIGSIGREVKVLYGEVAELNLRKLGKKVFYNPGGRELKFARDEVLKLLPHIDYYIANVEEACLTINPGLKRDQIEMNDLVKMVSDLGPENILITDGDKGVYAYNGYKLHYHPAQKVKLVEKTGAGDAFTSGLIGGISTGLDISKAAQWGNLNSSSAIQSFGAQTGLLTIDQLIELSGFKK